MVTHLKFLDQATTILVNGVDGVVLSVESVRRLLDSSERGASIIDGKANSVRIARGSDPGIGYLLMTKADADQVLKTTTFDNTITFHSVRKTEITPTGDPLEGFYRDSSVEITKMGVGAVTALTASVAYNEEERVLREDYTDQHDNTVVLVKFADPRWVARHSDEINSYYNLRVRHPEGTGSTHYTTSLNVGALFTYQQIIEDLWGALPTDLFGTLGFSLAYLPSEKPEGYDFRGHNAWDALMTVLSDIDHTIAYNPDLGTFYCVSIGGAISPGASYVEEYALLTAALFLLYQSTPGPAIFSPEKIKVYFHTDDWDINSVTAGANEPVHPREAWELELSHYTKEISHTVFMPSDSDGWLLDRAGDSTDIPAPTPVPGTVLPLYAPFMARFNELGVIQNQVACDAFATELAILRGKRLVKESRHSVYAGIQIDPLHAGGEVDTRGSLFSLAELAGIAWYNLGDGFRTEIFFSDEMANESPLGVFSEPESRINEYPAPPDKMRVHPPYEALMTVTMVTDIAAGGSELANIQVATYSGGDPTELTWANSASSTRVTVHEACGQSYRAGDCVYVHYNNQAKAWIIVNDSGMSQQAYGANLALIKADVCKEPGDSELASLYSWSGSAWVDTTDTVTVFDDNSQAMLLPGEFAWVSRNSGRYDIVGEYGLSRKAKAEEDIDDGGTGTAIIVEHSDDCVGDSSNCGGIAVCNGHVSGGTFNHGGGPIFEDEYIYIQFYEAKWHVIGNTDGTFMGLLTAYIPNNISGTMRIYTSPTADSGIDLTVWNYTGEQLETGALYRAFKPRGWGKYLVIPFALEEC